MTYIIAEIGINHNGSMDNVYKLMGAAADAGADAVKFQKRDPDIAVPEKEKGRWLTGTPWGEIRYIDYKHAVELWFNDYNQIDTWAANLGLDWSVSVWDLDSLHFIVEQFPIPWIKIPSAKITDQQLLQSCKVARGNGGFDKIIISTGMSELHEIETAIDICKPDVVMHCNSQYPARVEELNLLAMQTLHDLQFELGVDYEVGYSGHETGLATTIAAVALGASYVERHITLDRSMWGTDQAASVEPVGFARLVRDIRSVEEAMGDGVIQVYEGEKPIRRKLRGN
jgi:N-acetylneuraminate synthase